jgi:hypothetical protein
LALVSHGAGGSEKGYADLDAARQWAASRCAAPYAVLLGHSMGAATAMLEAGASNRLGFPAPGTYKAYVKLAAIQEVEGVPSADDMVLHLVVAQETTAHTARKLFAIVSEANDQPTADLLTQRLDVHEKTAWMLRSLLAA